MKKLILSVITVLMFSFSAFSNPVKGTDNSKVLLKQAKIAVEFLQKELKLKDKDSKLKELTKVYMAYAKNLIALEQKLAYKNKAAKGDKNTMMQNKKAKFSMMTEAANERDKKISKFLSKKQLEKYRSVSKSIHPFTLKIKEVKKKKTK